MSREPTTQRQYDQQAYRRHAHPLRPKFDGEVLYDETGRRWQACAINPYFTRPPPKPLRLYACFFGKSYTSGKVEVDPPELGLDIELKEGELILHLEAERSDPRKRKYAIFEVRETIND